MDQDGFFEALERQLDYHFHDRELVHQALTHKSYSNERVAEPCAHNERLEFLGDAVLELAVSQWVFSHYPDIPEGGLTRIRSEVVSEKGLLPVARHLDLGSGLRLGRGEEKSGGRNKPSLLTDALEALLGAVFCDGGYGAACRTVERLFAETIEQMSLSQYGTDHKTRLQERLQARFNQLPQYELVRVSGPDHQRIYRMEVYFNEELLGAGEGSSKKLAEQRAAAAAMNHPLLDDQKEVTLK
ncbi:MAG: ribonuclease III [Desulfuromonadales bacterium]|nr:ribonuclease III [Desulfuromonadales bacterium]